MLRGGDDPLSSRLREQQSIIKTVNELFDDWLIVVNNRLKYPSMPKLIFTKEVSPTISNDTLAKMKRYRNRISTVE